MMCYIVFFFVVFSFIIFLFFVLLVFCRVVYFFFFKQKTAYEMRISDWSSDVCSSDLSASYRAVVSSAGSRPSITSPTRTHQVERIPVATLRITTNDGSPIDSREDYDRARMVLDPMDSGLPAFDVPTRIRLRGNSTSWISVKPPFKIKPDTKTALAGMPANKDWGLLANFYEIGRASGQERVCQSV